MNAIKRKRLPVAVYQSAHLLYPKAVAAERLYCAAFFGHANPPGVVKTCESVWRGLLRRCLREHSQRKVAA